MSLKILFRKFNIRVLSKMSISTKAVSPKTPIVVSGPSGSGKSTLLTRLFKEFPDRFGFSVSHTTRQPREGEIDGIHYNFVDQETMQQGINDNEFIESAEFSKNLYGTSIEAVKKVTEEGKQCILDIDLQGVKAVKNTDLKARFVFISPPSIEELEKRLRNRNTETDDSLQARLAASQAEMDYARIPGNHDKVIINDEVDKAYQELREFIVGDQ